MWVSLLEYTFQYSSAELDENLDFGIPFKILGILWYLVLYSPQVVPTGKKLFELTISLVLHTYVRSFGAGRQTLFRTCSHGKKCFCIWPDLSLNSSNLISFLIQSDITNFVQLASLFLNVFNTALNELSSSLRRSAWRSILVSFGFWTPLYLGVRTCSAVHPGNMLVITHSRHPPNHSIIRPFDGHHISFLIGHTSALYSIMDHMMAR